MSIRHSLSFDFPESTLVSRGLPEATPSVKWYLSDTGDLNFYLSIGDIKAIYRIIILTLTIMIASILFFLIFYSALWAHTQTSTTDLLAAIDSSVFNKYSTFINSLILAIVYPYIIDPILGKNTSFWNAYRSTKGTRFFVFLTLFFDLLNVD